MPLHKARRNPEPDFILVEVAYRGRLLTYQYNNQEGDLDIPSYVDSIKDKANNLIRNAIKLHKNIKINLEQEITHNFQPANVIINGENDLTDYWDNQRDLFIARCDELEAKVQVWGLKRINHLKLNINKYTLLSGKSYNELPKWIKDKKACVKNNNKFFAISTIKRLI